MTRFRATAVPQQQAFVLDARLAPHVLPRDRIVKGRRIGHGGNGVVFAATLDGAAVCLKTLHFLLSGTMDDMGIERGSVEHVAQVCELQKEALNLVARRQHDNVVSFRGVVLDDDSCVQYIAMELLTGGAFDAFLTRYIAEHACVEPWVLLSWLVDSGCGLAFLHSSEARAVVHRDLKPENFLVRQCDDGSVVVVLGDLGESKALSSSRPLASSIVGNLFTKAPEVLGGSGFGPYSDVYSWALTVFAVALQGVVSPDGEALVANPISAYESCRSVFVAHGLTRLAAVDDRVVRVLRQCSAEEYGARPTMQAVVAELLAVAGDVMASRSASGQSVSVVERLVSVGGVVGLCV